jgi:hyperosmotically inducible periplasmic protein
MRQQISTALAALLTAGCMSTAALTRGAKRIGGTVTPAARAFADGTRRVVRYAGQAADDASLTARVKAAFMMYKGLEGNAIQVLAEDRVIRLTGHVRTTRQKQLAAEVARNTVGVAGVANDLRVINRS